MSAQDPTHTIGGSPDRSQCAPLRSTDNTFVFIGGLHRSGTTLLARYLAAHPATSGFTDTGAEEDEGQHLQAVYPAASDHGGPGRFGFAPQMHLTELSPLVTHANRRQLIGAWSRYWDYRCPVLIEKSPPNLLKTRFLQAMFPKSRFIMVLRHPVATALATRKWSRTRPSALIRHWLVCNERMLADIPHLRHVTLVRYEDLVCNCDDELARLHRFIGIEPDRYRPAPPRTGLNDAYFERWSQLPHQLPWSRARSLYRDVMARRFETRVKQFGYSIRDPGLRDDSQTMLDRLLLEPARS